MKSQLQDKNRDYTYLSSRRAAVGMHTEKLEGDQHKLTIALAFCNYRDQFTRRKARLILDGRLSHRLAGNDTRLTFTTLYYGEQPRSEVFYQIVDAVRENLHEGRLAFARPHRAIVSAVHATLVALHAKREPQIVG